ncbi:MAG: DUF5107 domain-containing protein, partial [Maribacter sp.]|nr:DUF5107 domain-containing protein [Maribacter sp.]
GKVWGAIEKSTGEEFLYKNEVIKFRNIAMRGPWTSGGIEFNFGIIGHHPSTATAVDYTTRTNTDGSVSCIVGNLDLPSNTRWTVEIRLEKDKAYFETNASWYNASPVTESYYNWMTAAAEATYDLEFFIPGNQYVEHNGNAHNWPIDPKGRNLSHYKNNTFGSSKSYHIVGEYNDFFGGYYHDSKFGFGQWSPYEEMPGQKLWLWDLSRGGGIWEDLLTDSDGQYIEFQAGRLFDQYSPSDATNPISQVGFDPYMMDRWNEIWFPYKEIGGMVDASEHGVLNVEIRDGEAYIGLNALQELNHTIQVLVNGNSVFSELLKLKPMGIFTKTIVIKPQDKIKIVVDGTELNYSNDPKINHLKRPFKEDSNLTVSKVEQLLFEGIEALEFRDFNLSHEKLTELVQLDPSHKTGLVKLGELEYRRTNYDEALEIANTVLKMDTYSSSANYLAGITYRAQKDFINALESLGWAARDIKYRSVAFAQMAEIHLALKDYKRAKYYVGKALAYNAYNVNAREVLLLISRLKKDATALEYATEAIIEIDPLNHFVATESAFMSNGKNSGSKFQNEFKEETILQSAIHYHSLGMTKDAHTTLSNGVSSPKNELWKAYLIREKELSQSKALITKVVSNSIDFVFPFRRETIAVLEWAVQQNSNWKLKYLLAQNYLAVGLEDKGKLILKTLGTEPDSDVFYRFRAKILSENSNDDKLKDVLKALGLNNEDWKVWEEAIQFYLKNNMSKKALDYSKKAFKKFPDNYNLGLAHAQALLNEEAHEKVIDVLNNIQILPYEHASESRKIYEKAHIGAALKQINKKDLNKASVILEQSKQWPENIGVGKPYNPDERMQDYLLAMTYGKRGKENEKENLLKGIVEYSNNSIDKSMVNHVFGLLALQELKMQDEMKQMISILKSRKDIKNNLALAFFNKDSEELLKIKSKSVMRQDLWDLMVSVLNN